MKYRVKIREIREVEVEIDSATEQDAEEKAYYLFDKGEITFPDYYNYENVDFTVETEHEKGGA